MEFFTNAKKTEEKKVDIASPAFSVTKAQATLGLVITAIIGVVPTALKENVTILVASMAAASLVTVGIFALVAVDIRTRQRAQEAKLRYGPTKATASSFNALPTKSLVLQHGHNKDEYEVRFATVEKDLVHLTAVRNGEAISATFKGASEAK